MKKIRPALLLLALLLACLWSMPAAGASEILDNMHVEARNALLVDVDAGATLYDQDAYEKAYPASITKIMTALLTLDAVDNGQFAQGLDTVITASDTFDHDLSAYGSTQNIKAGEQMSVKELLYCLLVPSANEAANILAEAVAGSTDAFVEQMNAKAAELGCTNTHFANCHGLHAPDHYTCAYDIYLIAAACMKNDTFREIVATYDYYVPATNLSPQRHFYSTNALLSNMKYAGYTYRYATGIKTGSTDEAGYCLVSSAEKDGRTLIAVVLGAENVKNADGTISRLVYSESSRLLEWGFENFAVQSILDKDTPLASVPVTLSRDADQVMVRPASGLEVMLPKDVAPEDFQRDVKLEESVAAPVTQGQVLGTLTLSYDGQEYGTVDLVAVNDVAASAFLTRKAQLEHILSLLWVRVAIAAALVVILAVVLRLTVFRRRNRYGRRPSSSRNYRGGRRRR